jgi:DNA topoisomerase-3
MQVTVMFQKMVLSDGTLKIADVSVKEECKTHPSGLNTVNMLKVSYLLPLRVTIPSP